MSKNAKQLFELIKKRYKPPEWVTFSEVSDGTGMNIARYADAISMSIWPSRGYALHGFEIKISRADWLKELNDPSKSWPIQRFCDAWWVVVADKNIVKDEELPKTWGLLAVQGDKLKTIKRAPPLKPERLTPGFIAAILRRQFQMQEAFLRDQVHDRIESRGQAADLAQRKVIELESRVRVLEQDKDRLQGSLDDFERVSGIKITKWNGEHLGETLNRLHKIKQQKDVVDWFTKAEASTKACMEELQAHRELLERLQGIAPEDRVGGSTTGLEARTEWENRPQVS